LEKVFLPSRFITPADFGDTGYAFQPRVGEFIQSSGLEVSAVIGFDGIATRAFLERFQRDAFGVYHYKEEISKYQKDGRVDEIAAASLSSKLSGLGIRINSENPRKTRIAAFIPLPPLTGEQA